MEGGTREDSTPSELAGGGGVGPTGTLSTSLFDFPEVTSTPSRARPSGR